jgi:hypothetical protein
MGRAPPQAIRQTNFFPDRWERRRWIGNDLEAPPSEPQTLSARWPSPRRARRYGARQGASPGRGRGKGRPGAGGTVVHGSTDFTGRPLVRHAAPALLSTDWRGMAGIGKVSERGGRARCRRLEPQGSDRHTHGCAGAARVIPEPPVAISQSCAGMAPTGVAWGGRRDSTPVPLGARAAVRPGRLPLARERRPRTASSGARVLRRESQGAGGGCPGGA